MKQSDLSEKTVALLDPNPSTPIVIIPKSRFVESSKGNTKFLDEVIHQKIVVKILPEVMFQGGMISRPENFVLTWEHTFVYVQHQNLRIRIYACLSVWFRIKEILINRPSSSLIF